MPKNSQDTVDIIEPIAPPSEAGLWYIVTLVDYATRYLDSVPLKKITVKEVAEAILNNVVEA